MEAYLAIDIGASSGRLIAGYMSDNKLQLQEIHRFHNGMAQDEGHMVWRLDVIFDEIIVALKKAHELGFKVRSLGIDTWGVDYVLLDQKGQLVDKTYAYRDGRTHGIDQEIYSRIPLEELYQRTGIQKLTFNTIYQLAAHLKQSPDKLARAESLLLIPDYLNYLLTGELFNEYTNATTTQLVNVDTKAWDYALIERLGLPSHLFKPLSKPGMVCGRLKPEIVAQVGFNTEVVMVASHDTASAVVATPLIGNNHIFLSSGTWSLMGIERMSADTTRTSCEYNFTNEGGYDYRFRYLKNIMGMWILQNLRRELPELEQMSFEEQFALAKTGQDYTTIVAVNDPIFLNPESMRQAFIDYCEQHQLLKPQNNAQLLYCAYHSLASCYHKVVQEIEQITGQTFDAINIIGGGCQDRFLNQLIARLTQKKIFTGPIEATALGNICAQMIKDQVIPDLATARQLIADSFAINQVNL